MTLCEKILSSYLVFFNDMKQITGLLLICLVAQNLSAQTAKPYFQQEVNYQINVTLDDSKHTLSGEVEFEYINHSPNALPEIWVHLWGNAFKNRRSAFCKQNLRDGDGEYYFSEPAERGEYKNLDFSAGNTRIDWNYDPKNPDIAVLKLPQALASGQSIRIRTPFLLRIPASFSRLGHVETSYQMTQWYPKPAVYDQEGWHAMPYLDIGEFYSEFGSFDVTITLPENYVVGATGVLQTPAEIEFLHQKERETRALLAKTDPHKASGFPVSSAKMKTIRYTAERVHDFAWFADKRFLVLKDTARLASGRTVDCWAMFPLGDDTDKRTAQSHLWEKGAFYVRRAVAFYSEKVGEYPYPQATAVHSALSAGGGMEYPMITVIGNSSDGAGLDDVITHEVGHNWFYGILASNEREHPFLDEGFNTYYENRYMREYHPDHSSFSLPNFLLNEKKQGSLLENAYLQFAREKEDTPPDSHANEFSPIGYGLQVYMKTAHCLRWLEQSLGTERFDAAMQQYYQEWQFKHPYPADFQQILTKNKIDANWFFEAMQTQKQVDYDLKSVRPARQIANSDEKHSIDNGWMLEIENKGALDAPFSVTGFKDGQAVDTIWYDPSDLGQRNQVFFPDASIDAFEIDYIRSTLDLNRKNNFRRSTGAFAGIRPLELRSLAPVQNARRNTLAVLPWLGWNNYDKAMVGLVIYNPPIPSRKLQYYLLPGYAFGSKKLVGLVDLRYKFYPGGLIPKITASLTAKTFDFDYNERDDYYSQFYRVVPQVNISLSSPSMAFRHSLNLRALMIGKEDDLRDSVGLYLGNSWKRNTIYELRYEAEKLALPHPWKLQVALETQKYRDALDRPANYLRGSATWHQKFFYQKKRRVTMRLFAGYFLYNTQRNRSVDQTAFSLNPQGFNDYKFDQTFPQRTSDGNFLARQVSQTEGGFKGAFGSAYAGTIGNSNNFILAMNLKADLPVRLPLGIPIKPYFDLGYFDDATPLGENRPSSEQLLWSGGLMLEFFKGGLEFYFPLFNSKTLKDRYCEQGGGTNPSAIFCGGNYLKMISWSMRLNFTEPVKMVEGMVR